MGDYMNKQKARYKIFSAMVTLLESYRLDEITIKMICAESRIHRSTFYAYFEDKYQLFNTMTQYHMNNYAILLENLKNIIEHYPLEKIKEKLLQTFKVLFLYIKHYQIFFNAVVVIRFHRDFIHQYVSITKRAYQTMLESLPHLKYMERFVQYTIGGHLTIIYSWLSEGCLQPPEEMAEILYTNIIKTNR